MSAYLPTQRTGPIPATLILHYWGATDHRVETNMAIEFAKRGYAGIVISLPYHMERCPPDYRSGELAITSDPTKLVLTMRQSISDIRRTFDFLVSRSEFDSKRFGIAGTSLGAIVAALASAVDDRITSAAFVVGGGDLAHVLWNSSRVVKEREAMRKGGYTESKLREVLAPIEPLRYLAIRRPLDAFVVGARFDTVIPPADTQKLIDALDAPKVVWMDTGHYGGFFVQKKIQIAVADYFRKSFNGETYVPPSNFEAPTVRLGIIADDRDFQIGVGLDLLRPNRPHDPFVTVLGSPQGLRLFAGATVDRGLSIGAFASPRNARLGLFWSIVL